MGLTIVLLAMLAFSAYGTLTPTAVRCGLPGHVDCAGGLLGPATAPANASFSQWFNVTLYDYGFWIVDSSSGVNESSAWLLFEGWTVHVNATSWPNDPSLGGTAYHGLGIEINATGTQLLNVAAPIGVWVSSSFVAPTARYSDQYIWCTVQCGPGHGGQHENNVFVVPSTSVPTVTLAANRTTGNPPLSVQFNATVTGGTAPFTWAWAFGDGNTSTVALSTTHTFSTQGNYQSSVTVVDSKGFSSSHSLWVDVGASPKMIVQVTPSVAAGYAPLVTQMSTTIKGGAPPFTYAWSFGDGVSSSAAAPSHIYASPGVYAAIVAVKDILGDSAVGWASISAKLPVGHLTVSVSVSPSNGTAPFTPTFTAIATGGPAPYQYAWLFGDGAVGSGSPAKHTYNTTGNYEVVAIVSDSAGDTGTLEVALPVGGAAGNPLTGQIYVLPNLGGSPLVVSASISTSGGTGNYATSTWTFGDGGSGNGSVLSHTYTSPGAYNVTATLSDTGGGGGGGGDDAAATLSTVVQVEGLTLQIATNRSGGDTPMDLGAIATIVSGSGVYNPVSWNWGDGTTGTGDTVNHTYASSVGGLVHIQATVTDSAGTHATATANVTLAPALLGQLAVKIPRLKGFPIPVNFTLTLSGGTGNYSKTALWNFGDGGSARGPLVETHSYLKAGRFHVTVESNDSVGGTVTASAWVNFTAAGSGTTRPPPTWVFNGLPDPNAVALALMGIIAFSGLLLLYRTRTRVAKKNASAIRKPPAKPAPSSSSQPAGTEPPKDG